MTPPVHYTDADLGDYAERVLEVLELCQRYYAHRTGPNLVAAKLAEMELRRLSLNILEHLGRRPPPAGQLTFFDAGLELGDEPPRTIPD